jgi:hypothetical protein
MTLLTLLQSQGSGPIPPEPPEVSRETAGGGGGHKYFGQKDKKQVVMNVLILSV